MVRIRRAVAGDIEALAYLRTEFLREMGELSDERRPALLEATRDYLTRTLPTGQFVAFVAESEGRIIATSGLILQERPPSEHNLRGLEAYVLNMYTLPAYRRLGIATALLAELIAFARSAGARRLLLYARAAGEAIYQKAGFTPRTGEMQLRL
jgi:GNAT superfamily N-acetyltransferase